METLNVYLCNRLAGKLTRDERKSLSFQYSDGYLALSDAAVLSSTLPLSSEPYGERDIAAFFSNLLPDESVRERIAEILRLSREDTFGLLRAIGGDCAGAIAFYEPDKHPLDSAQGEYRDLSGVEALALLRDLNNRPLGIDEEFRGISGAGAQDKLICCLTEDNVIRLPLHGTPSTHIIKPGIERFPESVYNEWFCMQLAKACGFPTAENKIVTFGNEDFYVTMRYDRMTRNGVVSRLHQEDFCQLLKCRPEIKYQDQGGPSIVECVRLLQTMRMPVGDVLSFIDRVIFNFIIGNGDAHGKNFSVLYNGNIPRLAPVYDALSTAVYPAISKKMAMKFDGKFEFRWVTMGKIVRTFARAEIGENVVRDAIARQVSAVKTAIPNLVDEANARHPSSIYHDIVHGAYARIKQLTA